MYIFNIYFKKISKIREKKNYKVYFFLIKNREKIDQMKKNITFLKKTNTRGFIKKIRFKGCFSES
jgi:hypothetical protein